MIDRNTTIVVACVFSLVICFSAAIFYWMQNTEVVYHTSTVKEKYMYSETGPVITFTPEDGGVGIGIPLNYDKFVLVLEDSTKHDVSWDVFVSHDVGDEFTYTTREWKP